ncbi:uncharacterized protein LOC107606980 [Arachis ipaensis]|uniref:uncharacterized protein LOC107606980 n=1 Tax=Arachis ipaensis TaxID=130454 RepID=UPI0007AFE18A|nr:uncharacterized protein LOC107606980 [Arachis ipaensis]
MNDQQMLADLDPRAGTLERPTPTEDLHKIYFTESTDKFTYIGSTLSSEEKSSFRVFLQQNADLFAWTPADMPGIDPSIISHKLALDPSVRPVTQKKKNLGHDRKQASLEAGTDPSALVWGFMDAYSGYNQIQMHPSNQNKTAFITEYRNYCYKVMPFGLKNAGATYQRLMDKVFTKQIGRNIEIYVDDMVAKTKIGNNHLDDLAEIFGQLRKYNMRLNPEKCAFGVQRGKFLGFLLTSRERKKKQVPIYFTSKTLQNAKLRYPSIEKLALALVFSARRLRLYFQSHEIHVRTDHPLRQVLQKPELAGRLVKWSVELSEFDINTTEDYTEWSLYVDGSSNPQGCGAGIILDDNHGNVIKHYLNFSFKASNNQSEHEALIAGLRLAVDLNITELKVYCDSLLIVQQHIPRESNGRADILSKLANTQPNRPSLYQSTLLKPSIEITQILSVTQEADWRIEYLRTGILPGDVENTRHFPPTEGELALADVHEGICGTHLGARSVSSKILRAGLYWPTYDRIVKQKLKAVTTARNTVRSHISRPNSYTVPRGTTSSQDYITTNAFLCLEIYYLSIRHNSIITDGRQFADQKFTSFLQNLKIKQHFSSVEHPQTNGLAEAANKVILHDLRKKLDEAKGLWVELIPEIIWGYNTTVHSTTKETPF